MWALATLQPRPIASEVRFRASQVTAMRDAGMGATFGSGGVYVWESSGGCDDCDALDGAEFDDFEDIPDSHPNCECEITFVSRSKKRRPSKKTRSKHAVAKRRMSRKWGKGQRKMSSKLKKLIKKRR